MGVVSASKSRRPNWSSSANNFANLKLAVSNLVLKLHCQDFLYMAWLVWKLSILLETPLQIGTPSNCLPYMSFKGKEEAMATVLYSLVIMA